MLCLFRINKRNTLVMKRLPKQVGGLSCNPNSVKYYVETCSPQWIRVVSEIKKARDKRDIDIQRNYAKGTMQQSAVVIKIGDSPDMDREYRAAQHVKTFKGFVKFLCFFTCNDDFREFFKGQRLTICKGPGSTMKVIVMPYFPLGSIAGFPWTSDNILGLRSCLYVACLCYIDAFKKIQFIHNDFHAANILLKSSKQSTLTFSGGITVPLHNIRPWIVDFENSSIASTLSAKDYEDFRYDISKLFYMLPTLVPQVDRSRIMNIVTFFQNARDICSDEARMQLGSLIDANVQIDNARLVSMISNSREAPSIQKH